MLATGCLVARGLGRSTCPCQPLLGGELAERRSLRHAVVTVTVLPGFDPRRSHVNIQAAAIGKPVWLRRSLRGAHVSISEKLPQSSRHSRYLHRRIGGKGTLTTTVTTIATR